MLTGVDPVELGTATRRESRLTDNQRTARRQSWLAILVPLVIVVVGAWTYRWVQEDAFINFRIVGNLLAGHGPVYNVGERVEVYSDPLWLFLLTAIHGVLPFLSLEWTSVVLGIGFTAGGLVLGGRATQRLVGIRSDDLVLPVGLLIFSVVAGVWEFVTGGLEMGMVFCWIGLTFWLLVRTYQRRDSAVWCAFVIGLGSLIRPELALMCCVFLAGLGLVVHDPGWKGNPGRWRRYGLPLVAALLLPVLYELWRMAYFAMIEPNTGLAKAGTSSSWARGVTYLWNFISPYTLWLPIVLVAALMAPTVRRWWRTGDRLAVVVLLTPIVAGLIDWLWVVYVGGDYMHARLLLPGFFALCVVPFVGAAQLRSWMILPVLGLVVWSVASAGWLRFDAPLGGLGVVHGISNERSYWTRILEKPHPITLAQWTSGASPGPTYREWRPLPRIGQAADD